MTPEDVAAFALALPEATEEEPYGPNRPVFKVGGSIFAMLAAATKEHPEQVTLKCAPDLALHLCEQYPAIRPWYRGRRWHWLTVPLEDAMPAEELTDMLHHAWECVVSELPRTTRERLHNLRPGQQ
ncbi:MmcQ/YjbR family DNA-binding protein [Streptomyces roseoverticillatus]|uniref:MmcQ/YjbR family DNA-binding protein n=1 Tax=Streptomyces roseoverticillatus TaxID=66429 RepID=UPI0004C22203|nr:MmcQ/YjbR family DNA-binding protein [Streptomyces roseoverticillatus]